MCTYVTSLRLTGMKTCRYMKDVGVSQWMMFLKVLCKFS